MKLDEIESVFRSSVKDRFEFAAPEIESVLFVSDLDEETSKEALAEIRRYLEEGHTEAVEWRSANAFDLNEVADVLDRVRRNPPSIVVCYRHLLDPSTHLPYSLGTVVDTLTQATDVPVLLIPEPSEGRLTLPSGPERVVVVTDHLTGDSHLVNWGAHLCTDTGTLYLSHVEDERTLRRYLDVIDKLPRLDSDVAREAIPRKLLELPVEFIADTKEVLRKEGLRERVESIVRLGTPVKEYRELLGDLEVDLMVINTKEEGQHAMDPLAYALAVEIQNIPLLLL